MFFINKFKTLCVNVIIPIIHFFLLLLLIHLLIFNLKTENIYPESTFEKPSILTKLTKQGAPWLTPLF